MTRLRSSLTPLQRPLKALLVDRGSTTVELALIAPILLSLLVGLADFGLVWRSKMQAASAAQAGAQYASNHGWNSTAIQAAVIAATTAAVVATPAPSQFCGCPNGSAITTAACGVACTSGGTAGIYVSVNARLSYTPLLPYPGLTIPTLLNSKATVRIQ